MEVAGVPNLHRVSHNLYRSGQPTAEGMENLTDLGVNTVINLRYFGNDEDEVGKLALTVAELPTLSWVPSNENASAFLDLVEDPDAGPFLVHCLHGADRTGAMCAIYRIENQGWTQEEAVREMTSGAYGFHSIWQNLIRWVFRYTNASDPTKLSHPLRNVTYFPTENPVAAR